MKIRFRSGLATALTFAAVTAVSGTNGQQVEKDALRWSFKAGNWVESPVIANDGTIYAGIRGKGLHAFSPDGTVKWAYKSGDGNVLRRLLTPHLSDLVEYVPLAIAHDGTIYAGSGETIYALSAEGRRKWVFTGGGQFSTAVLGADGTIYVTCRNNALYALTPEGKLRWSYDMRPGRFAAGPAAPVIGADNTIFAGDFSSHLHALTQDGKPKWVVRVQDEGRIVGLALASDGTIYVAGGPEEPHRKSVIHAFTTEGAHKWTYAIAEGIPFNPLVPVVGPDGTIYTGVLSLLALTPEGIRKWSFKAEQSIMVPPRVGANGTIYLAASKLYALSPEGTLIGSSEPLLGPIAESLTISTDGSLYVGTHGEYGRPEEGALFAFRPPLTNVPKKERPDTQKTFSGPGLGRAAYHGHIETVRELLASGADPNLDDKIGGIPLIGAAEWGHIEIVEMLLAKGADPNVNRKGYWWTATALMAASYNGHLPVVKLLLEKGADHSLRDKSGRTALMVASYNGHVEVVKSLLEKGADIGLRDDDGETALAFAKKSHADKRNRTAIITILKRAAK